MAKSNLIIDYGWIVWRHWLTAPGRPRQHQSNGHRIAGASQKSATM